VNGNWLVIEDSFESERQHQKETIFTIGNGYLGTRGSFEEGYPEEKSATLIHGVFDFIPIFFSELANSPNWINFELLINGKRFRLDLGQVISYRRWLDLRNGVLHRFVRWQSPSGEVIELKIERFASLNDVHVLALRYELTPINFSGSIELRSGLSGYIDTESWAHWDWQDQGRIGSQSAFLQLQTRATQIQLDEAFHINVFGAQRINYEYWDPANAPTLVAKIEAIEGIPVIAEKLVSVYTSRDLEDPRQAALDKLAQAVQAGYQRIRAANDSAWAKEWQYCNILIEGDDEADLSLRHSLFQLLIAAPRHDEQVSIAAKTLSGFGYRGHAFWDTEIFVLPFFIFTRPQIARNLLLYRYHTLPGARRKAQTNGYLGAMYAWESAATGDETTPRWLPTTGVDLIRVYCGDIEHHITADVAFAVMQYWRVTADDEFMCDYGAEIVLDTARFWGSRVEWNESKGYYEITNVIGPDEYHEGVDNNAYTNLLARWNLKSALEVLAWLKKEQPAKLEELESRLDINEDLLDHWRWVIQKIYTGFKPESGLFEQFEGFFGLKHVNLSDFEPRHQSMQALLGIQGVQEYQIIKQPDVLMLLYLLGDEFSERVLKTNLDYYTPLTDLSYGSSLGPAIQAILTSRTGDIQAAYRQFIHAARTDLANARGNTADGIHAATAGGLWQAAVFGFGGLAVDEQHPEVHPLLPPGWKRLRFRIQYLGSEYEFDLRPEQARKTSGSQVVAVQPQRIDLPKWPLLGAIFDLDGVLTDTSELHYQAWKRLADEENIPFNRADNEALRGISRRESLLLLLKGRPVSEKRMQEMMARKNRYYKDSISTLAPANLLPGVKEFLEDLKAAGVKIAIGSASKNAGTVIERLGIASMVDAIADGYSVERVKPAPDLFLYAAAQLGLPPEQCIVFEDAEAGVQAALAGGMLAVGVGPKNRVGEANLVIPGFDGLTWSGLLTWLKGSQQTA
jgi:kojibiose phosphorylase